MPSEQEYIEAIVANPYEDAPRLAYADSLEAASAGDLRAEFIRKQIAVRREAYLTRSGADRVSAHVQWMNEEERASELLRTYGASWAGLAATVATEYTFERGFVASITIPLASLLEHGHDLLTTMPITFVRLTEVEDRLEELAESELLDHIAALSLSKQSIKDDPFFRFVQSEHFTKLWWLDLSNNPITMFALQALAASKLGPRLRYLGLTGFDDDPRENAGIEGDAYIDIQLPAGGQVLEESHGEQPWLHFPSESFWDFPPNPVDRPV